MPRDGTVTRERILDEAHALILEHGLNGTSLDQVIEKAGITKGAFFYHFKSKDDLALKLIQRFAQADEATLHDVTARAEALSRDPLQQLLIMVGLQIEMFRETANPACLFASFCFAANLATPQIKGICRTAFAKWRDVIAAKMKLAAEKYPPAMPVNFDDVADMANTVVEGAMIMANACGDPQMVPRHLEQYRNYIELLFTPKLAPKSTSQDTPKPVRARARK
jgi:TetR/AcrR family transcriptional repressor of nem operon